MAKSSTKQVDRYRKRLRENGGVIVYAAITDPKAIAAWNKLKEIFGNNRDAIEDALINSAEQLENA